MTSAKTVKTHLVTHGYTLNTFGYHF